MTNALLIAAAAALVALAVVFSRGGAVAAAADRPPASSAGGDFSTDLYAKLAEKDGNLFFSPASIQAALAMTAAGARGQTAEEMYKTLHLKPGSHEQLGDLLKSINADGAKGGYELSIANALWGLKGYPFAPDFIKLVKEHYDGNLSNLDFAADPEAARKTINDWVAKQTRDRIQDLLGPGTIQSETRLVLTNAIYFKGAWDRPFKKERTQDEAFTTSDGKKQQVPMMSQTGRFLLAEDDEVQVLELTYGKGDLAMRIILPKQVDGLKKVESQLTPKRLTELAAKFQREEVRVALPKFRVESSFSLAQVLKGMGMPTAFSNSADFSGMTTAESLMISAVLHKAFVQVDEQGTEAAAASAVLMAPTSAPPTSEPKVFRADHPFVFSIVHVKTNTTLFMGRVEKP